MSTPYHVKFIDSDDEELPDAAHACPPAPSATTTDRPTEFHCASTIRTDYDTKDQCYVLKLVHSPGTNIVAATLSNHLVKLFSFKDSGLQFSGQLQGHTGSIRDAQFAIPEEPHILHTSSSDGSVRGWDTRSGQQVEVYNTGRDDILACHSNGKYVAAGASDKVLLWDRTAGKAAASFSDTHAGDVTQVVFHPSQRGILVTASDDGLVAVFNTEPSLDEDEGFVAAINIDTAPAKIGFYDVDYSKLWCCSSTETLHLWDWADACNEMSEDVGAGPLGESLDARQQLTALSKGATIADLADGVDYLIGCEYSTENNKLMVAAGTISGASAFFTVVEPEQRGGALQYTGAVASLLGGHQDIVRSILWPGGAGPVCLSGGEDGRVCVWKSGGDEDQQPSTSSGGSVQRRTFGSNRRASPYDR